MKAVEARAVCCSVGSARRPILRDLSIEVEQHAIVAVVGPVGSGKTTFLRLLAGLIHPDCGSLSVLGHDLHRMSEEAKRALRRQKIAYLSDEVPLLPELSLLENVMLPGRLQGTAAADLAVCARRSLSLFEIEDLAERKPVQLSMGQKRLGGIARTLTCPADLLILDEPTSSLDVRQRERVASVLRAQNQEQHKTIIFTTHYLPDASVADMVVIIQDGRIARRLDMGTNRDENLSAILHNLTQILPLAAESAA